MPALRHYSSSCLSAQPTQLGFRVCQLVPESPPLSPQKPSGEVLNVPILKCSSAQSSTHGRMHH